jgi:thiol-disulfide isomerase/thioredoxin
VAGARLSSSIVIPVGIRVLFSRFFLIALTGTVPLTDPTITDRFQTVPGVSSIGKASVVSDTPLARETRWDVLIHRHASDWIRPTTQSRSPSRNRCRTTHNWYSFPMAPSFDRETGMFRKACILIVVAWMACLSGIGNRAGLAVDPISSDEIRWVQSVDQALRLARSQQRPVLIHFFGDNCPPCKMLDKKAFRDTGLIQAMNTELIAVRINADEERDVARRYQVSRWPTDVYLYPNGDEIYRNISSQDPVAYAKTIDRVSQKSRDWKLEQPPTTSPSALAGRFPSPSTSLIAKTPLPATSQPMADVPASDTPTKPSLASRFGQWTKSLKGNKSQTTASSATPTTTMDPGFYQPRTPVAARGSGDIASSPNARSAAAELATRLAAEHAKPNSPPSMAPVAAADAKLIGARLANASVDRELLSQPLPLPSQPVPPASPNASGGPSHVRLVSNPKATSPDSNQADSNQADSNQADSNQADSNQADSAPSTATATATLSTELRPPVAITPESTETASASPATAPASAPSAISSAIPAAVKENVVGIQVAIVKEIQDANTAETPAVIPSVLSTPSAPAVATASLRIDPELALQGFCPVKLHQAARQPAGQTAATAWVPGRPEFAIRHRGRIYHCSSSEARALLLESPDTWTPTLSGCDLVEYARSGKWVDGNCQFGFVEQHSGRIFLFASKSNYDEFARNCDAYSKMMGDPSQTK